MQLSQPPRYADHKKLGVVKIIKRVNSSSVTVEPMAGPHDGDRFIVSIDEINGFRDEPFPKGKPDDSKGSA